MVDTFTDVDGTLLLAHTPDVDILGGGWDGGGIITGDKARIGVGAPSISLIDSGMSDMVLEATLTKDAGGVSQQIGLIIRSNALSTAFVYVRYIFLGFNDMRIVHGPDNTDYVVQPVAWPAGGTGTIRVEASGTLISVYLNDVFVVSTVTADELAEMHQGLWGFLGNYDADDFSVCPFP